MKNYRYTIHGTSHEHEYLIASVYTEKGAIDWLRSFNRKHSKTCDCGQSGFIKDNGQRKMLVKNMDKKWVLV